MKDTSFSLWSSRTGSDHGKILDDCLYVDSEIYDSDDWPGSEQHYRLTKEQTKKVLKETGGLEGFIRKYQKGGLSWFQNLVSNLGLHPEVRGF